jgi:geranylgeranyl pyrophosphate synthase
MQFGVHLGFAFQLKDDLLDYDSNVNDPKNLACHLGVARVKDLLDTISRRADEQLLFLGKMANPLTQIIEYNIKRTH